jgi:hypothetical protein
MQQIELTIRLPIPHAKQAQFLDYQAKRKVVKAGRRGGKTEGMVILAVEEFMKGRRVLYAAPTAEQVGKFWRGVTEALRDPILAGIYYKNESESFIEKPGTENRIKAKTAWNADTLRGDYADVLILDEFQLMNEDAWGIVGAPMLLDNNGDAIFCFTPPSLKSRSVSKATDKKHANKLYKKALERMTRLGKKSRWAAFHFTSWDNPHIPREALEELSDDMTALAIRQEIEAEDIDQIPGALWSMDMIEAGRVIEHPPLFRIGIGVDPHASSGRTGIVAAGIGMYEGKIHGYLLGDKTTAEGVKPEQWATASIAAYNVFDADILVAEINNGGDMVGHTLMGVPGGDKINFQTVRATRGKYVRAEPVSALYGDPALNKPPRIHHVGTFPELEEQMCSYVPGDPVSPNNLDAAVWILTKLMIGDRDPDWDGWKNLGKVRAGAYKPLGAE